MLRSVAITRINDGLGFRGASTGFDDKIVLRLQEAQRDLESGKTLPRFLLQQDQTLMLTAGLHQATLPSGFIRESDDGTLRFISTTSDRPIFLARKYLNDAIAANIRSTSPATAPSIYVMRNGVVDFVTTANITYTLTWDYYKKASLLTTDIENEWLASSGAPEWLIGEAGYRIASDSRDANAKTIFAEMRQAGRAACFGEDIASESASGPIQMGANL